MGGEVLSAAPSGGLRPAGDSLAQRIADYQNTADHNEGLHAAFTRLTDTVPLLKRHRDWVEARRWGYGDRAFHYLWWLALQDLGRRFGRVRALEIGVYKGQTISLWALIARELGLAVEITALSPFAGNTRWQPRFIRSLRKRFDRRYRAAQAARNLHPMDDYLARNREIFAAFDLDFAPVRLVKGYSNDPAVMAQLGGQAFELVYVDGDHSFEVVSSDIANYAPLVVPGGYLVMDDAACELPGETFWKGVADVSRAARAIPALGFDNLLNVGHNRLYRRN
ncbi:MAG: class I SAM-dependent methyltransferase [Kiloniellales bacterium]